MSSLEEWTLWMDLYELSQLAVSKTLTQEVQVEVLVGKASVESSVETIIVSRFASRDEAACVTADWSCCREGVLHSTERAPCES